jgi:hypothetical protein
LTLVFQVEGGEYVVRYPDKEAVERAKRLVNEAGELIVGRTETGDALLLAPVKEGGAVVHGRRVELIGIVPILSRGGRS